MSQKPDILVPPPLVSNILKVIQALNPEHPDVHIIVIAAETGSPPTLTGSMHPDSMHDIFQWLIDHKEVCVVECHDMDQPETPSSIN